MQQQNEQAATADETAPATLSRQEQIIGLDDAEIARILRQEITKLDTLPKHAHDATQPALAVDQQSARHNNTDEDNANWELAPGYISIYPRTIVSQTNFGRGGLPQRFETFSKPIMHIFQWFCRFPKQNPFGDLEPGELGYGELGLELFDECPPRERKRVVKIVRRSEKEPEKVAVWTNIEETELEDQKMYLRHVVKEYRYTYGGKEHRLVLYTRKSPRGWTTEKENTPAARWSTRDTNVVDWVYQATIVIYIDGKEIRDAYITVQIPTRENGIQNTSEPRWRDVFDALKNQISLIHNQWFPPIPQRRPDPPLQDVGQHQIQSSNQGSQQLAEKPMQREYVQQTRQPYVGAQGQQLGTSSAMQVGLGVQYTRNSNMPNYGQQQVENGQGQGLLPARHYAGQNTMSSNGHVHRQQLAGIGQVQGRAPVWQNNMSCNDGHPQQPVGMGQVQKRPLSVGPNSMSGNNQTLKQQMTGIGHNAVQTFPNSNGQANTQGLARNMQRQGPPPTGNSNDQAQYTNLIGTTQGQQLSPRAALSQTGALPSSAGKLYPSSGPQFVDSFLNEDPKLQGLFSLNPVGQPLDASGQLRNPRPSVGGVQQPEPVLHSQQHVQQPHLKRSRENESPDSEDSQDGLVEAKKRKVGQAIEDIASQLNARVPQKPITPPQEEGWSTAGQRVSPPTQAQPQYMHPVPTTPGRAQMWNPAPSHTHQSSTQLSQYIPNGQGSISTQGLSYMNGNRIHSPLPIPQQGDLGLQHSHPHQAFVGVHAGMRNGYLRNPSMNAQYGSSPNYGVANVGMVPQHTNLRHSGGMGPNIQANLPFAMDIQARAQGLMSQLNHPNGPRMQNVAHQMQQPSSPNDPRMQNVAHQMPQPNSPYGRRMQNVARTHQSQQNSPHTTPIPTQPMTACFAYQSYSPNGVPSGSGQIPDLLQSAEKRRESAQKKVEATNIFLEQASRNFQQT